MWSLDIFTKTRKIKEKRSVLWFGNSRLMWMKSSLRSYIQFAAYFIHFWHQMICKRTFAWHLLKWLLLQWYLAFLSYYDVVFILKIVIFDCMNWSIIEIFLLMYFLIKQAAFIDYLYQICTTMILHKNQFKHELICVTFLMA